jgi:hypothetical protein
MTKEQEREKNEKLMLIEICSSINFLILYPYSGHIKRVYLEGFYMRFFVVFGSFRKISKHEPCHTVTPYFCTPGHLATSQKDINVKVSQGIF